MFCEPKGQELNTFICKKKSDFLTPMGPLVVHPYRSEKIVSDPAVCRSNLTHLRKETQ